MACHRGWGGLVEWAMFHVHSTVGGGGSGGVGGSGMVLVQGIMGLHVPGDSTRGRGRGVGSCCRGWRRGVSRSSGGRGMGSLVGVRGVSSCCRGCRRGVSRLRVACHVAFGCHRNGGSLGLRFVEPTCLKGNSSCGGVGSNVIPSLVGMISHKVLSWKRDCDTRRFRLDKRARAAHFLGRLR